MLLELEAEQIKRSNRLQCGKNRFVFANIFALDRM
jgi:hypothetical protein